MKTFLSLMCIITLFSCNRIDDSEINDVNELVVDSDLIASSINQNIISDLVNGNFEDEKVVYSTLNSKEKLYLWEEKLGSLVQDTRFNKQQLELLSEFKNLINEGFFESKDIDFLNNKTEFEALESKAKILFEKELAFKLFYTPQNIDNDFTKNTGSDTTIGTEAKCECSIRDDWCFSPSNSDCTSSNCESKNGCGFFLIRRCDGECE